MIKKFISVFLVWFLTLFVFISCSDFMNGDEKLNELTKAVDYVNAPYVTVQIKSDVEATSSIHPIVNTYESSYKKGDAIQLEFATRENYAFINWEASPSGAVSFENSKEQNTTAFILDNSQPVIIEPKCQKRPEIARTFPTNGAANIDRSSDVKIIFNQNMSDHSIYWTETEMSEIENKMKIEGVTINKESAGASHKDENGEQYYYAYTYSENDGPVRKYKNIEIKNVNTEESLLYKYYDIPRFESPKTLIIPVKKSKNENEQLQSFSDIEVTIGRDFCNEEKIECTKSQVFYYYTNSTFDIEAPKEDSSIAINGRGKIGEYDKRNKTASIYELLNNSNEHGFLTAGNGNIIALDGGSISDDHIIDNVKIELTPIRHDEYEYNPAVLTDTKYINEQSRDLSKNPITFSFMDKKIEGVYLLTITITDSSGNSNIIKDKIGVLVDTIGIDPEVFDITTGIYGILGKSYVISKSSGDNLDSGSSYIFEKVNKVDVVSIPGVREKTERIVIPDTIMNSTEWKSPSVETPGVVKFDFTKDDDTNYCVLYIKDMFGNITAIAKISKTMKTYVMLK